MTSLPVALIARGFMPRWAFQRSGDLMERLCTSTSCMPMAGNVFSKQPQPPRGRGQPREVPRARHMSFLRQAIRVQVARVGQPEFRGGAVHFGNETGDRIGLARLSRRGIKSRAEVLGQR